MNFELNSTVGLSPCLRWFCNENPCIKFIIFGKWTNADYKSVDPTVEITKSQPTLHKISIGWNGTYPNQRGEYKCDGFLHEQKNILDISNYADGLYIVKVQTEDGNILNKKVLKQ